MKAFLDGFNITRFCDAASSKDVARCAALVYVGTLILAVAQALLAAALASEAERVAVHESAEHVLPIANQQYAHTASHTAHTALRESAVSTLLENGDGVAYPYYSAGHDGLLHQGPEHAKAAMADHAAYGARELTAGNSPSPWRDAELRSRDPLSSPIGAISRRMLDLHKSPESQRHHYSVVQDAHRFAEFPETHGAVEYLCACVASKFGSTETG